MPRPSARAILAAVVLPIGLLFGIHGSASIAQTVAPGTDTPIVAPANAPATQPAPDNTQAAGSPASAEFDLGQKALADHQAGAAIPHFKAVIDNPSADPALVSRAKDQLAAAQAELSQEAAGGASTPSGTITSSSTPAVAADPERALYDKAIEDMRADRFDAARAEFQKLVDDDYQPPVFHRTPKEMLVEIAVRTGQPANGQPASPVASSAVAAADASAPASAPASTPTEATAPSSISQSASPSPAAPTITIATPASGPATPMDRLQAEAANEKLATEQKQFRARGLVDLARDAYAHGDKAEALRDYTQAADLDPSNPLAQAGKNQLLGETGNAAVAPAASQFRNQIEVELQDINFRFSTAIRDAKAAIAADDFAAATQHLEDARVARSLDPGVFPQEQLREMDATIAQVDQQMKDERAAYDTRTAQATRTEIAARTQERLAQQKQQRDETIANLIRLARQDTDQRNYTAALGVLDQILILDPNNDYAIGVRQFLQDRAILQDQRKYREAYDLQYAKQLTAAEEKLIPYDDIIRYPSNWPDISEQRDQEVQSEQGLSREDQATTALLNKVLPEANFDGTPFTEAVDYLRDYTGANIFVNTKALEAAGVDRATPITVKLHSVKFSKALSVILGNVGGQTKLAYDVDEGVITISTADQLNQAVVQQVYSISDLLQTNPNFQLQDASSALSSLGSGGGGGTYSVSQTSASGGGGQTNNSNNIFSGGGNSNNTNQGQMLMDQMVKLITDTVASDSWKTNGGTVGAISELINTGQIVVTQTPDNQRLVEGLLAKIREKRNILVTVEVRFLTVSRDFVEAVGLNLDAAFNLNRSPGSVFSSVPVHILDNGFTTGSSGITTGVPGSIGSAAAPSTVAFTYLDDFQVNFMLQAVEASSSSTIVNAPRLTVYDGNLAVLAVGTSFQYVSNLTPIVGGGGAVGFTATVQTASSGILLSVQPTVSADRKYVNLILRPSLALPPVITPFNLTAPASQTTTITGGGTTILGGSSGSAVTETIQLVTQNQTFVETVVAVPDGGTLLLGGETIAGEAEREQGLPVLSKIPFLKRLFTNTATAKDQQVALILVKPTILIQREQEDKAFPLLSNRPVGN